MEEQSLLIQKRGRVKASITRLKIFADLMDDTTSYDEVITRFESLEKSWSEFLEVEDKLLQLADQESDAAEYEEKYFFIKTKFSKILRVNSPQANSLQSSEQSFAEQLNSTMNQFLSQQQQILRKAENNNPNSPSAHLPKLNVPSFSGDYKEWPAFKDLFIASIHTNQNLSKAQKLQYLKGLLRGNAMSIIKHLFISDSNYEEAWNKLNERYNKEMYIATSFIKTFIEQSSVSTPSAKSLRQLHDTYDEVVRGLRSLGKQAEERDPWLIFLALSKLDAETKGLWAQHSADVEFPSFEKFLKFLSRRCDALEASGVIIKKTPALKSLHLTTEQAKPCPFCHQSHPLFKCQRFRNEAIEARRTFVSIKSRCFKCLGGGHTANICRSKIRCNKCKSSHHPLLHLSKDQINNVITNQHENNNPTLASASPTKYSLSEKPIQTITKQLSSNNASTSGEFEHQSSVNKSCSNMNSNQHHVSDQSASIQHYGTRIDKPASSTQLQVSMLPTAVVNVPDSTGNFQECRLLLDSGSQVTLISESCVQRLGMVRENARLNITGLESTNMGVTRGKVKLKLYSRWNSDASISVSAFIMKKLTALAPSCSISCEDKVFIKHINLADPNYNIPGKIDIILGCDRFFDVLKEAALRTNEGIQVARETIFGWILFGNLGTEPKFIQNYYLSSDIDKLLARFWQQEEMPQGKLPLLGEDLECEDHFKRNVSRDSTGRYTVALPFNQNSSPLGESKHQAVVRLLAMERKFEKNPVFKEQYHNFMVEYENLGHMELVHKNELYPDNQASYFLPHHAVFKKAPVPKIRVVFDGSCKTAENNSLNDHLLVGPVIQRDLYSILLSFRKYDVALCADLEKMYRQIWIRPEDRDFQRIVWRSNQSQSIQQFRLKTVTYGTSSAPYLATRILQKISEDYETSYPKAAAIIRNCFYVDDMLAGCSTLAEAAELKSQLQIIFNSCGFNLTKWQSNHSELSMDSNHSEGILIDDNPEIVKLLGVHWIPKEDNFVFTLNMSETKKLSKRIILSESSKIFDPLGWLAPIIIKMKILFQSLWLQRIDWDDCLPEGVINEWNTINYQLSTVPTINIPRRILHSTIDIQLHGYADASEAAYAAVVYCRSIDAQGQPQVVIIGAKTKVAPLKQLSLPRLELSGAVLLSKLLKNIITALAFQNIPVYAWVDSTAVLAWLADVPRRWKTFIANRTSEILSNIPQAHWGHVRSADNPADLASRGISSTRSITSQLWWQGPQWLRKNPENWPQYSHQPSCEVAEIERRKTSALVLHQKIPDQNPSTDWVLLLINRSSSFSNLIRIVSYCLRFINNTKRQSTERSHGHLHSQELTAATNLCIQHVQQTEFFKEITQLKTAKSIHPKNKIINLSPFLDGNNILRVGGRIQRSGCRYSSIHPIILPKNHHLSKIIVTYMHKAYLHPGASQLISLTRQQFWILGIRDLARKVTRNCLNCFRQRPKPSSQLMGDLPEARVTVSRPFYKVGVDYAGPMKLASKSGRGAKHIKCYIAVFVCLSTKALHLELVSSLSTEAFLAALQRFISRRGVPCEIWSDNGTNFVGARRCLGEMYKWLVESIKDDMISGYLAKSRISWKFIPPSSPHFGGIWESAVKSTKGHLKRVIGETTLTFEEFTTLLYQIEAILNSRPYVAISNDPNDLEALTPSHFLVGEPLTSLPEPNLSEIKVSRLGRWQHIQAMVRGFWNRWRNEYVSSLQKRTKWSKDNDNLKVGDLVLINEDNTPPSFWPLARITDIHPGSDGRVRVVTLRTKKGLIKRPIVKLSKLPLD